MLDTLILYGMIPLLAVGGLLAAATLIKGGMLAYDLWQRKRNPVAFKANSPYRPMDFLPHVGSSGWDANKKATLLLKRTLGLSDEQLNECVYGHSGIVIEGGATHHQYRIAPKALYPIYDMTSHIVMCGVPFNNYSLPLADTMLAQALYLRCPETERHFVALCNKVNRPDQYVHQ